MKQDLFNLIISLILGVMGLLVIAHIIWGK